MTLKELINKATPLPWRLNQSHCGYTGHSIIVNASVKSVNGHDFDSVRVIDKTVGGYVPEVIAKYQCDFALMVHCVNNLGQVVEALEDYLRHPSTDGKQPERRLKRERLAAVLAKAQNITPGEKREK